MKISQFIALSIFLVFTKQLHALELIKGDARSNNSFEDQATAIELMKVGAIGLDGFLSMPGDDFYYVLIKELIGRVSLPCECINSKKTHAQHL